MLNNKKITVIHHTNQLSLGGTEKTIQIFCKYLPKDIFNLYVIYNGNNESNRLKYFVEILNSDHILAYKDNNQFRQIIENIKPEILHVHRMGTPEFPEIGVDIDVPIFVETNIFGGRDDNQKITKTLFVSNWLMKRCSWANGDRFDVLPNPIELPYNNDNLRSKYDLGDKIVIGRVGRPADEIYDDISIRALSLFKGKEIVFFPLAPSPKMVKDMEKLKIPFVGVEPTADDLFLSSYYNSIDILAHARLDGETFGCNIAEAMIHGKPVISHLSNVFNAQTELIDHGINGYIVGNGKYKEYFKSLNILIKNPQKRGQFSKNAKEKILNHFEASKISEHLKNIYIGLYKEYCLSGENSEALND
jgi:glycosyltransferase involved in cell wall biosynthesis